VLMYKSDRIAGEADPPPPATAGLQVAFAAVQPRTARSTQPAWLICWVSGAGAQFMYHSVHNRDHCGVVSAEALSLHQLHYLT
jgi:hypothetical protein